MSERNSLQMDDYAALFDCLSTDMPLPDIFDISYSTDVRINASSDNDEIPILPPLFSLEPPSGGYESPASEYLTLLQDPYLHPMNSISKDSPKPMVSDDLSFANICQTIANEFPGSIKSEIPRISSNEYTYLINNKHSNSKVRHGPSAIKHESQRSKKCAHSRSNKHILRLANADLPRSLKTEFKHGIKCESLSGPKPSPEHCTQLAIKPVVSVELEDAFNAMLYQEIRGECLTPGCHAPVRVRGYCKKHGGARKCSVSGCTKGIQGKSRCIGHGGGKRCSTIGWYDISNLHHILTIDVIVPKALNPMDSAKLMEEAYVASMLAAPKALKAADFVASTAVVVAARINPAAIEELSEVLLRFYI